MQRSPLAAAGPATTAGPATQHVGAAAQRRRGRVALPVLALVVVREGADPRGSVPAAGGGRFVVPHAACSATHAARSAIHAACSAADSSACLLRQH